MRQSTSSPMSRFAPNQGKQQVHWLAGLLFIGTAAGWGAVPGGVSRSFTKCRLLAAGMKQSHVAGQTDWRLADWEQLCRKRYEGPGRQVGQQLALCLQDDEAQAYHGLD